MSDQQKPDNTPGTFAWNELVTRDKDASVDFYTKLFGWTSTDMPMPGGGSYTMFNLGERMVAGLVTPPPEAEGAPTAWLSYIHVEDVDAAVAKAKELGANICNERIDIPMGSFAIVTDPQGAAFAFWQSAEDRDDS